MSDEAKIVSRERARDQQQEESEKILKSSVFNREKKKKKEINKDVTKFVCAHRLGYVIFERVVPHSSSKILKI